MPTDVERLFTTASQLETDPTVSQDTTLPGGNYIWNYVSEGGHLADSVDAPAIVFALNAIDSSVIDVSKGY